MATVIEIDYFNSYWLKRIQTGPQQIPGCLSLDPSANVANVNPEKVWPGPFWYGDANKSDNSNGILVRKSNVFLEESRIRAGYNNLQTDLHSVDVWQYHNQSVFADNGELQVRERNRINNLIY